MDYPKVGTILTGVAGEYLVAAELTRRGYIASITLRNTRGVDVLVASGDAHRSIGIQVKTNEHGKREWMLSEKHERIYDANIFYVFVSLSPSERAASFHVVPSTVVAETIAREHQKWLQTPGKGGKARNDGTMRKFRDLQAEHLDRWDVLGL